MRTLVTKYLLPLLLLLLLPVQPQTHWKERFPGATEDFLDYLEDIYSSGPTRPPTKAKFIEKVIANKQRKITDGDYCNDEIKYKNVHYKLGCVQSHYFINTTYEVLQNVCTTHPEVPCKNGIRRCRASSFLIKAVYCMLTSGTRMPECYYDSFERNGYVLMTCRWHNETREFLPDHVQDVIQP
uniref:Uncharacterized protein n=1 Tax=Castor canadensis TaxID=51338 RepID=A0A8C0WSA4_CASCN|nr:inactive ribonuclease-like protein 9 [Castor canadensis]